MKAVNQWHCRVRLHALALSIVSVGVLSTVAWAGPPADGDQAAEDNRPANERARAIVDQLLAKYQSVQTYQDRFTINAKCEYDGPSREGWPKSEHSEGTFAFAGPNRIARLSTDASLICDGRRMGLYLHYIDGYDMCPAPAALDAQWLFHDHPALLPFTHPAFLALTLRDWDHLSGARFRATLDGVEEETKGGRLQYHVQATGHLLSGRRSFELPFGLWIDAQEMTLTEVCLDLTAMSQAVGRIPLLPGKDLDSDPSPGAPKIEHAEIDIVLHNIILDKDIPPERFALQKKGDARKFTSWLSPAESVTSQLELIGQPAPDFKATDLKGADLSLEQFRGRILVLDFWSTTSAAAVAALPRVQSLFHRFQDKPVTVIGVNMDGPTLRDAAREIIAKLKLRFPQVFDEDAELRRIFRASFSPSVVVIDDQGVIQFARSGCPVLASGTAQESAEACAEGIEEGLTNVIDKLLAGESVLPPRPAASPESSPPHASDSDAPLPDYHADRLAIRETLATAVSAGEASLQDVDGDGTPELVVPDFDRRLIVAGSGRINPPSWTFDSPPDSPISRYQAIHIGDDLCWAATLHSRYVPGKGSKTTAVALFDDYGRQRWVYRLDMPSERISGAYITVGDVTGERDPEIVVGLSTYIAAPLGDGSWTRSDPRGYLLILDREGHRICQREIGQFAEYVAVLPPRDASGSPTILGCGMGGVRRFAFTPDTGASNEGD